MVDKKIVPYKITKLGVDFDGKPVVQQSFKGNFTQDQITEYVQKKSNIYKNKGSTAQLALYVRWDSSKRGWRSGQFTPVGDPVDWHNDQDWYEDAPPPPTHFSEFRILLS